MDFTRKAVISGGVKSKRPEEKHLNYFDSKRLMKELYKKIEEKGDSVYYLILLCLTSGMRFGELVGLTRGDFDFKNSTISVTKIWGYTNKMPEGFGPTKNDIHRKIKMDKKTMKLFEELFKKMPKHIHDLVFYSPLSKYKVISNNGANKILKQLLKEMNIDVITMHGLRHTHASVLLYKKVSIYYVSERLGHKDIDTTLSYYAHIVKELRIEDEKNTADIFGSLAI